MPERNDSVFFINLWFEKGWTHHPYFFYQRPLAPSGAKHQLRQVSLADKNGEPNLTLGTLSLSHITGTLYIHAKKVKSK